MNGIHVPVTWEPIGPSAQQAQVGNYRLQVRDGLNAHAWYVDLQWVDEYKSLWKIAEGSAPTGRLARQHAETALIVALLGGWAGRAQ